jgi:DNA-binding MarR family transcriptional regulator
MNNNSQIFSYTKPEENTGYLLWQVTMQWQLSMNRALRQMDLTLTQFSLMAGIYWLTQQQKAITQQQLADFANTDKMMTSKVLIVLERKHLIEKKNDRIDSRAKLVSITPKGTQILRAAYQIVQQMDNSFFKSVAKDKVIFDDLLLRLMK